MTESLPPETEEQAQLAIEAALRRSLPDGWLFSAEPVTQEDLEVIAAHLYRDKGEEGWRQAMDAAFDCLCSRQKVEDLSAQLLRATESARKASQALVDATTPVLGLTAENVMASDVTEERWIETLYDIFI